MRFVSTILCVDDDEDDLFFLEEVIRSQNISLTISECRNGWEAINYLEKALLKNELPCLIIMDMNMPKMDGRHTIQKIKENNALSVIPIVLFTTSSSLQEKHYFENQGIHFITKPFDYKIFINRIVEVLAYCADLGA
jgi:CheY-like chemotaxis protein